MEERISKLYERLFKEAESGGYHLNPDKEFTLSLIEGLIKNEDRYGYWACPCRLAFSEKGKDLDIICPCDYRDADLLEYGACYCALYVSDKVLKGKEKMRLVPERRPPKFSSEGFPGTASSQFQPETTSQVATLPVWRCRVCGYLCAREQPPEICPVCKAKQDRFERFKFYP